MMTLAWILGVIDFLSLAGLVWCCVVMSGRCSEAESKVKLLKDYPIGEWDEEPQEELDDNCYVSTLPLIQRFRVKGVIKRFVIATPYTQNEGEPQEEAKR